MEKPTVKKLQNKYKNADIVVSVQCSKFSMKNYDLSSIYYDDFFDSFYIKNNDGVDDKELFECSTGREAEIVSYKS